MRRILLLAVLASSAGACFRNWDSVTADGAVTDTIVGETGDVSTDAADVASDGDAAPHDAADVPLDVVHDAVDALDVAHDAVDAADAPRDVVDAVDQIARDAADVADGADGCGLGTTACSTGCVDLQTDPMNCGGCGTVCPTAANQVASCSGGTCSATCAMGYGDCDTTVPGCETQILNDPTHCGSCTNACPAVTNGTAVCSNGACSGTCTAPAALCTSGTECGTPPAVTGIAPSQAFTGDQTPIRILGSGFSLTGTYSFVLTSAAGTVALQNVTVVSATEIDATVPFNSTPGDYLLGTVASSTCTIALAPSFTIASTSSITVMVSPSVMSNRLNPSPPLTVTGGPFQPGARVYLVQSGFVTTTAVPIYQSSSSLVVPMQTAALNGTYDVMVINPDGTGNIAPSALMINNGFPPFVTGLAPTSAAVGSGATIVVSGPYFDGASGTVLFYDSNGNTAAVAMATVNGSTLSLMLPSSLAAGLYQLGVTNSSGFVERTQTFTVLPTPLAPQAGIAAPSLNVPRSSNALVSTQVEAGHTYLYAIGGTATDGTALASIEVAEIDPWGHVGPWRLQHFGLPSGLEGIQNAVVELAGELFVVGGSDGSTVSRHTWYAGELNSIGDYVRGVNAIVNPPSGQGVSGYYIYQVAAVHNGSDFNNPNGESLPSDEVAVNAFATSPVTLTWRAMMNVASYRIYRTAMNGVSGSETFVTTVLPPASGTPTWTDDNTIPPGTQSPQPAGSLSTWFPFGDTNTPRMNTAVTLARDSSAAQNLYMYAIGGDTMLSSSPDNTYEYWSFAGGSAWMQFALATPSPVTGAVALDATPTTAPMLTQEEVYLVGGGSNTGLDTWLGWSPISLTDGSLSFMTTSFATGGTHWGAAYPGALVLGGELFQFGGDGSAGPPIATIVGAPISASSGIGTAANVGSLTGTLARFGGTYVNGVYITAGGTVDGAAPTSAVTTYLF